MQFNYFAPYNGKCIVVVHCIYFILTNTHSVNTLNLSMRHKGSDSEFKELRDNEIFTLYRKYLNESPNIVVSRMLVDIVNSPSSRFWITEQRAAIVLGQMRRGDTFPDAYPQKRAMYRELYRRAEKIWIDSPSMSVYSVASLVVEQPAPSFYMSTTLCNLIISRAKKRECLKRKKSSLCTCLS